MTGLSMGGYGAYVWPAFGITLLVLLALLWASVRRLRANEALLADLQQEAEAAGGREARRRRAAGSASSAARGTT